MVRLRTATNLNHFNALEPSAQLSSLINSAVQAGRYDAQGREHAAPKLSTHSAVMPALASSKINFFNQPGLRFLIKDTMNFDHWLRVL